MKFAQERFELIVCGHALLGRTGEGADLVVSRMHALDAEVAKIR
jgi:hypothetical protein